MEDPDTAYLDALQSGAIVVDVTRRGMTIRDRTRNIEHSGPHRRPKEHRPIVWIEFRQMWIRAYVLERREWRRRLVSERIAKYAVPLDPAPTKEPDHGTS